jgi:chromosome segregation ATPase
MDENVIKEKSTSISDRHVQLSRMLSNCNPEIVLGQVHELQSQVQTLSTKLALLTELAEKDQRESEQDKARLGSQISELTTRCRAAEGKIAALLMDMKANAQDVLSLTTQKDTSNQAVSGLELKLHQCQVELASP